MPHLVPDTWTLFNCLGNVTFTLGGLSQQPQPSFLSGVLLEPLTQPFPAQTQTGSWDRALGTSGHLP